MVSVETSRMDSGVSSISKREFGEEVAESLVVSALSMTRIVELSVIDIGSCSYISASTHDFPTIVPRSFTAVKSKYRSIHTITRRRGNSQTNKPEWRQERIDIRS